MTRLGDAPEGSDGLIHRNASAHALRRLGETVAHLSNDPEYFLAALTEMLLAMRPIATSKLTEQQERYLIESGAFTARELAATMRQVDNGSLQLGAVKAWLSCLYATLSIEDVSRFLGWREAEVRAAASAGRLYSVEVSGRPRFPVWQFSTESPGKLLPGLPDVIKFVAPRWNWCGVTEFMATPHPDLIAKGRKTPVAWLRDGGDVDDVIEIVEASDWS